MTRSLGQSSIEYLTTYGWMVLAAGLAASALYPTVDRGCNVQIKDDFGGALAIEQVGVDKAGDFKVRLDSETNQRLLVESLNFSGGGESIEVIQPRKIAPGAEITYPLGVVEKTGSCNTYNLNITFDKGPLKNQMKSIRVKGSLNLIESFINILRTKGDRISSIIVEGSIMPTNSTICIGSNCPGKLGAEVEGPAEYVNQSADEMRGRLITNHIKNSCYGVGCNHIRTSAKGYVSHQNNTVNGTLNVTEIKPITALCLGKCNN